MEIIKRKILLEDSIDRNYNSPTYGALTATSFYLKILLTQTIDDMGSFTDAEFIQNTNQNSEDINRFLRQTGKTVTDYHLFTGTRLSGLTESKIEDVRSYNNLEPYKVGFNTKTETYLNYSGGTVDGVDRVTSLGNPTVYVFDADENDVNIGTEAQKNGLLYKDITGTTDTTTFSFIAEGLNSTNTSLSAITKEEYLFGIICKPEVKSDVFIDRGIATVFERHLKLSEITNLGELTRYGNGFYKLTI